jgi:signal transduction protein with GAF and PtsI domain
VISLSEEITRLSRTKPASLTTLTSILQKLQSAIGAEALTIYQFDPQYQHLVELVSVGKSVELVGFLAIGQGQGLTGWAALQKKPLVLKNRTANTSFDPDRDFACFLATPLPVGSAPIGVLAIGGRSVGALDIEEADIVEESTEALSSALERYLFCKRLETATKEVDRLNRQYADAASQIAAGRELGAVADQMVALNHEVNEALSVIIGHIQCLVADRAATNQKELSRLRRMEESALRIRTVNQNLLKLARSGQARQLPLAAK